MDFEKLPADTFPFPVTYALLCGTQMPANEKAACAAEPQIKLLVGDPDEIFPLASVTKPIAAYAVLVGVEKGLFHLDEPVGPPGSTLRHLLAHASGLPAEPGAVLAAPGKRRIYSNYAFDVLAQWVEEKINTPICDFISENVLVPLEMDTTVIAGSIAYSGKSTLDSLLRFASELLSPQLISTALFATTTSVAFPGISGVLPGYGRQKENAWGLGFEIRAHKQPHWLAPEYSADTFGHFGQSGSFIFVDPRLNIAGVFLGAQNFGKDHLRCWPQLTAQMREKALR